MEQLVCAVFLQAVKDLERDRYRSDAQEFFNSDWFFILADIAKLSDIDLDPRSIQQQVNAETYQRVSIRAAYR